MTLSEQIKQCKSMPELARLLGQDDMGAALHILTLHDIDVAAKQVQAVKTAMRTMSAGIIQLEHLINELQAEINASLISIG